jgi:hypothetical protein
MVRHILNVLAHQLPKSALTRKIDRSPLESSSGDCHTHHGVDADQSARQRVDDDGLSDDPVDLIGRTSVSEMIVQLIATQYGCVLLLTTADPNLNIWTHQACKVL